MFIERRWSAAVGVVGFLLAWILTTPQLLGFINWDQGAYISGYATGRLTWSTPPWNAHFGIGHVYWLAAKGAGSVGGTPIVGFRLANTIAFAAATVILARLLSTILRSRALGLLATGAWATAWVNLFLLLSLEDNVLYLPFVAGVVSLCVRRADAWSLRDSLIVSVLVGCAALVSWQALLYLGLAVYVAAVGGDRQRPIARRARDVAAVIAGFLSTLALYCLVIGLTSSLRVGALLASLFSRPTGSFTIRPITDVRGILDVLGTAASYMILHDLSFAKQPPALPLSRVALGTIFFAAVVGLFLLASRVAWRRRSWAPHVLAASLGLFVLVTPLYRDVAFRYLIRFDFLPLFVVPLLALLVSEQRERPARAALALLLSVVCAAQLALALRWDVRRHAYYPSLPTYAEVPRPEPAWYGREGQSWYQYFHALRQQQPAACRYVFDLREVWESSWQFDQAAALWSELPGHVAIGSPDVVRGWRYPPRVVPLVTAQQARWLDEPCSWISPDARRLLSAPVQAAPAR